MSGVLDRFMTCSQIQARTPPAALASVNDGTLYMPAWLASVQTHLLVHLPTATAMPPGNQERHGFPTANVRRMVMTAKRAPAAIAHSFAMCGRPWPVTNRAVNIQT